jgi:hypothetical protein
MRQCVRVLRPDIVRGLKLLVYEALSYSCLSKPFFSASAYFYICVLILLHTSPRTASVCPRTTTYVSSYYYICVLILKSNPVRSSLYLFSWPTFFPWPPPPPATPPPPAPPHPHTPPAPLSGPHFLSLVLLGPHSGANASFCRR